MSGRLSTGQRILKNFFSLTAANIVSYVVGFIIVTYLARTLTASGFGQISFAQAIISYFMLLSNLGLKTLGIREVARDIEQVKEYVSNILTLRFILVIISFALLLILLIFINKPINYKILIAFYGLSLFPSTFLLDWTFKGIERMEFVGVANIIRPIIYAGFILLFIKSPSDILDVPLFSLIASFTIVVFLFYFFVKNYGWFSPSFNLKTWKKLLASALPMGFASIMIMIYYNMDTIMLGFMKGDEVVGWYNAAYKIVFILLGLLGTFFQVLYPVVSFRHKHRREELGDSLELIMKYVILVTTPIVFGGIALADKLLILIFGAEFRNGALAFKILICNLFIVGINSVYGSLILLMGEGERDHAIGVSIGAVTNIILNFLLIPKWSLYGAAVATVTTEVVVTIYVYWASYKTIKVGWAKFAYKPLIASAVMFFLLTKLNYLNIFVLLAIGIIVYVILVLLFNAVGKKDLMFIKGLMMARGNAK